MDTNTFLFDANDSFTWTGMMIIINKLTLPLNIDHH